MSLVFRQMGVYLKTLVSVVILVFLLVFYVSNRGNRTDIWVFQQFVGPQKNVPTNAVVFASLIAGVLCWWLVRWMVTLPGQWRTLRQDTRRQDLPTDQEPGGK